MHALNLKPVPVSLVAHLYCKMGSVHKCSAVATLLLFLAITCSGHVHYYIKPTPDTPCPANPCFTLSEYAQQPHHYLTSNTTLLFLPGDHILHVNFTVENASTFELLSTTSNHPKSRVVCKGLVGFTFRNVSSMTLNGLTFKSCGKDVFGYGPVPDYYGISIASGKDNLIVNCSFQESIGTALGVFYSRVHLQGNSFTKDCNGHSRMSHGLRTTILTNSSATFAIGTKTCHNNSADCGGRIGKANSVLNYTLTGNITSPSATYGGGIHAYTSNLNLTGNILFGDISADSEYGSGIKAINSIMNLIGNITFRNNLAKYGGGIYAGNSNMNFTGNILLGGNSAEYGGGIKAMNSTLSFIGNITFRNNSAKYGGGVYSYNSNLTFTGNIVFEYNKGEIYSGGNSMFQNNSAGNFGGGIKAHDSTLRITGSSIFRGNSAEYGGGIYLQNSFLISTGNTEFRDNSAMYFGGGIKAHESTLNFNTFRSNSAVLNGGGVETISSALNFVERIVFANNSAAQGGGISTTGSTWTITGNTAFRHKYHHDGGSVCKSTTMNISRCSTENNSKKDHGDCNSLLFMHNSAEFFGGAVHAADSTLNIEGCNILSRNSARYCGGGVHSLNSTLKFSGNTTFSWNSAQYNGGGIHGVGTNLYFSGTSSFTANTACRGGGEYLSSSFILLSKNSTVIMENNNATEYGGAVYVEDSYPITRCASNTSIWDKCLFQIYELFEIPHISLSNLTHAVTALMYYNIHLHFRNNHAQNAGSAVYGGSLDICHINVHCKFADSHTEFKALEVYDVFSMELEANSVSSDPFRVCPCEDGKPSCNTSKDFRQVYPGELLCIPVVAVGQNNGVVPGVVRAFFTDTHGNTSLAQFQDTQKVKKNCTELYYQVHSSIDNINDTLVLYADGPCSTAGKRLSISLHFLPCPPGFSLNSFDSICGCEPRLQTYNARCNITERTLTREGEFWVGYDDYSELIILHPHCPFDYCKPAKVPISFHLNNTDLQCENNRSGVLCGGCKSGLSLALGSSKCLQCTNLHQLLLLPFALAGIGLILLLLICKLTVAAGTINGLIFYANVVTVNRAIFFPPNQTNILTVFISWVNLDLGIETCFFDGMNEYSKTWLQFIFPLYVWSLVVLIIIASDYSSRLSRLFGSNPVAVLATLFLLSYGKFLRTVITAMFSTILDYSNEVKVTVWLCDGNVRYFHGKHIALFLAALLSLLLFLLPYTLLLTVGQWLQANSNRKLFRWINKPRIKPFLDAYQAPYRDQHRYWTGLLLCLRCALFLVFACNTQADPSINLLAISSVTIGLTVMARYTGAVYRKLHVDVLETSFIVNLGILAVATYYVKLAVVRDNQLQATVAYTSVGIAFATFIGVLLYHTYLQVWPKLQRRFRCLHDYMNRKRSNDSSSEEENHEISTLIAPTTTIIDPPHPDLHDAIEKDIRPLITPYTNFIELREPLDLINSNDA